MDRINSAGTIDLGGGKRGFRDENLGAGTEGTVVSADHMNALQEELLKIIEEAGLDPDDGDWSQVWQALKVHGLSLGRTRRWMAVLSITTTAPPGAPTEGDAYLVPTGATGAWAGQVGKIAEWTGTAWSYFLPPDGHGLATTAGEPWVRVGGAYVPLFNRIAPRLHLTVAGRQAAPPGGPAEGALWIVGAAASGSWAGHDHEIAVYLGGSWRFVDAASGTVASMIVAAKLVLYYFDGAAWQSYSEKVDLAELVPITLLHETRVGSAAGYLLANDWSTKRLLNTVVTDQIGVTLASNEITVPPGVYRIEGAAVGFDCGHHRVRLYNVTTAAVLATGTSEDSHDGVTSASTFVTRHTFATTTTLRVQHLSEPGGERLSGDDQNIAPDTHIDAWLLLTRERKI